MKNSTLVAIMFIQIFFFVSGGCIFAIWQLHLKYTKGNELFNNRDDAYLIFTICFCIQGLFALLLGNFDWRSRSRKIGLTLHALYFLFCEFIHAASIWILYLGFCKSNSEWENIFRASGEIIAIIFSLFNSIHCTCIHIRIIYCTFKEVSFDRSVLQFPYSLVLLILMILTFIPSFWSFTLCPIVVFFISGLMWARFGPNSMFDLSKMHTKLGTGTFKVCCWVLLIVEAIFFHTKCSKEDEKKHLIIAAIAIHNVIAMIRIMSLNFIYRHELKNAEETENDALLL